METETFKCRECGQDKPRREGRIWDEWVGVCRDCRRRARLREAMRKKRREQTLTEDREVWSRILQLWPEKAQQIVLAGFINLPEKDRRVVERFYKYRYKEPK